MDFIHDDMTVLLQRSGIVNKALQEDACRHERNFGDIRSLSSLHANMVAHSLADSLADLLGDSLCNVHGCDSSRLCADDVDLLVVVHAPFKNVLGHLGCLATACVSTYD